MTIGDTGISPSYKRPGFIAKISYAAGSSSGGSNRLKCLLVGFKTSGGTMVADQDIVRVTSDDEIAAAAGPRSMLARGAYKAILVPSVDLYLAAVSEPGGGTAGTVTILLGGTPGNGILRFRLAGVGINVNVNASMSLDDIGAALVTAFNGADRGRLPATAAYNAGTDTLTLTLANVGASGRDWILYFDPTGKPSALTLTITGSATVNTNGYRFGAGGTGTGVEDVTTLLTKLLTTRYARSAWVSNDATNLALIETHINSKESQLVLLFEQFIVGHNGTLNAAMSLSQTTMNAFLGQLLWQRNSESHPFEIAAAKAALRSVEEQTKLVPDYDGRELAGIAHQRFFADIPTSAEIDLALQSGVTPLTTVNETSRVVRSICSYSLNGTQQDERCLDIGDPTCTQGIVDRIRTYYDTAVRPNNPYAAPDRAEGEPPPAAGTMTPRDWSAIKQDILFQAYNAGELQEPPIGKYAPTSTYNTSGKFIQGDTPIVPAQVAHRIDEHAKQIKNV